MCDNYYNDVREEKTQLPSTINNV